MNRLSQIVLLIVLVLSPLLFYKSFNRKPDAKKEVTIPIVNRQVVFDKPKVAIIFDGLGETLQPLEDIYALDIAVTLSVLPGLKFSRNIAHIGSRCGFSVLTQLPFAQEYSEIQRKRCPYIKESLTKWEVDSILKYSLNYIRIAVGVDAHIPQQITNNKEILDDILTTIQSRNLCFINNYNDQEDTISKQARKHDMVFSQVDLFLKSDYTKEQFEQQWKTLKKLIHKKEKVIILADPDLTVLKQIAQKLLELKSEMEFVTVKGYFE